MTTQAYLRPTGLLQGPDAQDAVAQGLAGALAGGAVAFTQAELIERTGAQTLRTRHAYADLAASSEGHLEACLSSLTAPRHGLRDAGLPAVSVMGVVNVTPDSFSDGGEFSDTQRAVAQGLALAENGADILDIGGESTRPGADAVSEASELERVLPVIEGVRGCGVPISIDTRKSGVMRRAVDAGAAIVNDITALRFDVQAMATVRELGKPVILMHSAGDPKVMQDNPTYDDVVLDVYDALAERIAVCEAAGIDRARIIADPGIGFGKTFVHNHELLRSLAIFHGLGVPLLLGVSRKAFIGRLTGEKAAGKRVVGSVAAALTGLMQGVQILRVHDVDETVQAVRTWRGIFGDTA